jgi:fumarylpyruvate hydrolase
MTSIFPPALSVAVPIINTNHTYPVRRVYCVGRNYLEHAQEMGFTGREPPFFFLKPADVVVPVSVGEVGKIAYPSLTQNYHHEIELVVAIGRSTDGNAIVPADALKYVYGYAVGLDMTRRDLQNEMKQAGRPWCIGKAFEQSAPIGVITPASHAGDIFNAAIELTVNGVSRQHSHLSKLIWTVPEIIAHLSAAWTLQPGDLIYTGTPAGVAAVVAGDVMVGTVTGLASLTVQIT